MELSQPPVVCSNYESFSRIFLELSSQRKNPPVLQVISKGYSALPPIIAGLIHTEEIKESLLNSPAPFLLPTSIIPPILFDAEHAYLTEQSLLSINCLGSKPAGN